MKLAIWAAQAISGPHARTESTCDCRQSAKVKSEEADKLGREANELKKKADASEQDHQSLVRFSPVDFPFYTSSVSQAFEAETLRLC